MIPKGNQRGGGQQLATHLLNEYDNDTVEIADVRGTVAQDLHGAFAEWYAQSQATQCKKYLYSLSLNPDHRQGPFSRDLYFEFIARAEKKFGLKDQPRAVVFHVKEGREHCHVVWSRIDIGKMKSVHMDHDHNKLRKITQDFARDHGITLPLAMQKNGVTDRFNERANRENYAEKQQQERTGVTKQERRRSISEAWRETGDATSFVRALEQRGYFLARGDKRAFVVIDLFGEIHSLSRQLEAVKAKEFNKRMDAFDIDRLPDAAAAQDFARKQNEQKLHQKKEADRQKEIKADADRKRSDLEAMHRHRREELQKKRDTLTATHREEANSLRQMQKDRAAGIEAGRRQPKGIVAFLSRITGIQSVLDTRHRKQDMLRVREDRAQTNALRRRHAREMEDFSHHEHALGRVEKRELRSLRTELRRDQFRALAAPTREQRIAQTERDLKENIRDITAPPPAKQPVRTKDSLADTFRKSAEQGQQKQTPQKIQENAADITKPPAPQKPQEPDRQSLKEAFQRRAAQKRADRERDGGRDKHHHRPAPDPFRFPAR